MATRDVFTLLADPTRRRILEELCAGERTVGQLVTALGTPQPSVSKHLKQLGEADLVRARVDGPRRHYAVQADQLLVLDLWLAPFRRAWADRLDDLERHLDTMDDHQEQS
ncbi:ArsR/SmtB family transcription factor [Janibacter sp. G349]|jgi:DNA-binding transcriptional ArsR family regulator|uniref:ArsR/SmtB family transcription factor n=1 Tax=unclassified Janibacter TaxID=2649294 RepID=UPI0020CC11B1|nr:metalloregulator ArsR/SmtB family transcription factor [Janibacter sp. CX7]UTT65929.1 metalloregulator ArsR/SmtB family transcription factor [Janibacter sp. CX7]